MGKMIRFLKSAVGLIDCISKWTGHFFSFLVVACAILMSVEVVARYVLNSPTKYATEATGILFGIYLLIIGAYVLYLHSHVSVDVVYSRLSQRGKAIIDIFTSIFFFAFIFVLLREGIPAAIKAVVLHEHTQSIWGAPLWPTKIALALGALLIFLQGLAKLIRDLYMAFTLRALQ